MKAKDIMTKEVISVLPETTLDDLAKLLIDKKISGAPVITKEGRLVGIVTENDLIRQNERFHIPTVIRLFDAFIPLESDSVKDEIRRISASSVSEIATSEVISVDLETPLQEIATIMAEKGVHLLPVLDAGRVVGIIAKMDVIRGSIGEGHEQES